MKQSIMVSALAIALSLAAGFAAAADPSPVGGEAKTQKQEPIFGSQLMTQQERADYRAKMRAAKTVEEREQIRKEHHASMAERAKARGVTLPAEPPAKGGGTGLRGGTGPRGGMGPGGGMGQGPGSVR